MIQRIQSVYLLLAAVAMVACAFLVFSSVVAGVAALLAACLSLYDIALYKKRPLQAVICKVLSLAGAAFIAYLCIDGPGQETLWLPVGLTAIACVLWLLAARAIGKDEKLVRSLDRIR